MSVVSAADFTRLSPVDVGVGVVVPDGLDGTSVPPGVRPWAVAVLATEPASTSAWVTAYGELVHV
ncbi:hypothetical protein ASG91_19975, partial [Phycicoccus sp. Soil802]